MNITVYCGSRNGARSEYLVAATELGTWIAKNGHTLVYGGGRYGLMGAVSNAVLDAGGKVIGITPDLFIEEEKINERITELEVTPSMSDRRDRMMELGDAFIALPGGIGTLDEISEIMVMNKLAYMDKPCIFYNVAGYYDSLKDFFKVMIREDLYAERDFDKLVFAEDIGRINETLTEELCAL